MPEPTTTIPTRLALRTAKLLHRLGRLFPRYPVFKEIDDELTKKIAEQNSMAEIAEGIVAADIQESAVRTVEKEKQS